VKTTPSATLRRRVSTLPRMPTISRSGRLRLSIAMRRTEPVATRAPAGRRAARAEASTSVREANSA